MSIGGGDEPNEETVVHEGIKFHLYHTYPRDKLPFTSSGVCTRSS